MKKLIGIILLVFFLTACSSQEIIEYENKIKAFNASISHLERINDKLIDENEGLRDENDKLKKEVELIKNELAKIKNELKNQKSLDKSVKIDDMAKNENDNIRDNNEKKQEEKENQAWKKQLPNKLSRLVLTKEDAKKKIKDYLIISPFSKEVLISQLKVDGFSSDEAEKAVEELNIDFKENALEKAKKYMSYKKFTEKDLKTQLLYDGFTEEEAEYGVDSFRKNK